MLCVINKPFVQTTLLTNIYCVICCWSGSRPLASVWYNFCCPKSWRYCGWSSPRPVSSHTTIGYRSGRCWRGPTKVLDVWMGGSWNGHSGMLGTPPFRWGVEPALQLWWWEVVLLLLRSVLMSMATRMPGFLATTYGHGMGHYWGYADLDGLCCHPESWHLSCCWEPYPDLLSYCNQDMH